MNCWTVATIHDQQSVNVILGCSHVLDFTFFVRSTHNILAWPWICNINDAAKSSTASVHLSEPNVQGDCLNSVVSKIDHA